MRGPEFAVKGEAHDGKVCTIHRGFVSLEEAEDCPVVLSKWRRVWAEQIEVDVAIGGRAKPGPKQRNRKGWANAAFGEIEAAVKACPPERCPFRGTGRVTVQTKRDLALTGRVKFEVYGLNWCVATILVGPLAGKSTAPPPFDHGAPYLVMDKEGITRLGRCRGWAA